MTKIRRLYDKDQEVIICLRLYSLPDFSNQRLDWGELANLDFGNGMVI